MDAPNLESTLHRLVLRAGWIGWAVFWLIGVAFIATEGFAASVVPGGVQLVLMTVALLGGVVSAAVAFRILSEDLTDWRNWVVFLVLSSPWLWVIAPQAPSTVFG